MLEKLKNIIRSEYFFLIPFGIWVFFSVFRTTLLFPLIEPYYIPVSLLCMSFIVVHELAYLREYNWKDYAGAFIALAMFIIQFLLRDGTVMYSVLCIFVARHANIKKIMFTLLVSTTAAFMITIISSQIGLVEDYFSYDNGRNRHYLGFIYALIPSSIFINITAIYLFLRDKKVLIIEPILLVAMAYILYLFTDSRLPFVSTVVVAFGVYFIKFITHKKLILNCLKVMLILFVILAPISNFVITYKYNPSDPVQFQLDKKFGYRFYYGKKAVEKYSFHFGPNRIGFHGNGLTTDGKKDKSVKYDYVDSFYLQYSLRSGLLFMSLYFLLYLSSVILAARNNNFYIVFLLAVFAIIGIITDKVFTLYYNAFLITLSQGLIKKEKNEF